LYQPYIDFSMILIGIYLWAKWLLWFQTTGYPISFVKVLWTSLSLKKGGRLLLLPLLNAVHIS
jgi:hypothetical protein